MPTFHLPRACAIALTLAAAACADSGIAAAPTRADAQATKGWTALSLAQKTGRQDVVASLQGR